VSHFRQRGLERPLTDKMNSGVNYPALV